MSATTRSSEAWLPERDLLGYYRSERSALVEAAGRDPALRHAIMAAAEMHAVCAVALGDHSDRKSFADLQYIRAQDARSRGCDQFARTMDTQAAWALGPLAAAGDAEAAAELADLTDSVLDAGTAAQYDAELEAIAPAAAGDLDRLRFLIRKCADIDLDDDDLDVLDSLAKAEALARLGCWLNRAEMAGWLASALQLRAIYERRHGARDRAVACLAEAVTLFHEGIDRGDPHAAPCLAKLLDSLRPAELPQVVGASPGSMPALATAGRC